MRPPRALPVCRRPADIAEAIGGTWRCFTWEELAAASSDHAVRRAVTRGQIARIAPNTYVSTLHSTSLLARADALSTWLGHRAVIGGHAALFLAGADVAPPSLVDAVVHGHDRVASAPHWMRVRHLSYDQDRAFARGFACVAPDMAAAQAYGSMPDRDRNILRALQQGVCTVDGLHGAIARMPRVKGREQLLATINDFSRGAESVLEVEAMNEVFADDAFDFFARQHDVWTGRSSYRLDMFDVRTRTAVELDGITFHAGPAEWQHAINRDAELASVGIVSVRLSSRDLRQRPDWCRRIVLNTVRERSGMNLMPPDVVG